MLSRRRDGRRQLFGRHGPLAAQVIERRVSGDLHEPGGERRLALLVPIEGAEQLNEDVLRDVLGVVRLDHDAADVALHVPGELEIEVLVGRAVATARARDGLADRVIALATAGRAGVGAGAPAPRRATGGRA